MARQRPAHGVEPAAEPARAAIATFARDERGGVLIVFALALIPILALTGLAVDHGRASAMKSELQRGLDVAVLAGATKLAETGSSADAEIAAGMRFKATGAARLDAHVTFTAESRRGRLTAIAHHDVPTLFLAVVGLDRLEIDAKAVADVAPPRPVPVATTPGAPPTPTPRTVSIDDYDLAQLIDRVREVCGRLRSTGLDRLAPQCAAVFDGSFEQRIRTAIATDSDPEALLPAGVRLVE